MKTSITALGIAALLLQLPGEALAQQRWSFEIRGGAALPTQDVGDDDLGTGFGFEGTVGYRLLPHLGAYAGWDWHRFAPDALLGSSDVDLEETGYAFGLRWAHPFQGEEMGSFGYWVRGGLTVNHIEIEDGDETVADSGHGLGWEAGVGLSVPVGEGWDLTPGLRYRSLTREVDLGEASTDVDLRYLTLGIGVTKRF